MPEEAEIDTEQLRDKIDKEIERDGGVFLRKIALTTAVLAALAAIASLRAGATVNEALVLKTEATRLQAQTSDQWAYYQAKGLKAAVSQSTADILQRLGPGGPSPVRGEAARYAAQQDTIRRQARALEKERDERSRQADSLLKQHHVYAASVALLQIAIALGAIAALTRSRFVWFGSIATGLIGAILFGLGFINK
jgi:hypothetical protein